jgi:dihydroxyacetone kinase phosphotransfer subunit
MVNLLIVSHSGQLASGVKEFVEQIAHKDVRIGAAGGTDDGNLGTSANRIKAALEMLTTPDGILVLVDLGSAVMSVQTALEMLDNMRVLISEAPLVEGAYLAATEASVGASLEETAAAALQGRNLPKLID